MTHDPGVFGQERYVVRSDWGPVGAREVPADVTVIVDVLSFSTSVCIAVERGMRVFPYPWKDERARAFAEENRAVLAVGRLESRVDGSAEFEGILTDGSGLVPSLSPSGLLQCPVVPRLVLPSPNGSTIAAAVRETGAVVVAGCLRNADAVAGRLAGYLREGKTVSVIAAGERWRGDDSLRPAVEDQIGTGAVLSGLAELGYSRVMSPEALAMTAVFESVREEIPEVIATCASGRELIDLGFGSDVEVAAGMNSSLAVPVLVEGAFVR